MLSGAQKRGQLAQRSNSCGFIQRAGVGSIKVNSLETGLSRSCDVQRVQVAHVERATHRDVQDLADVAIGGEVGLGDSQAFLSAVKT